jgi:hypothetical protein
METHVLGYGGVRGGEGDRDGRIMTFLSIGLGVALGVLTGKALTPWHPQKHSSCSALSISNWD